MILHRAVLKEIIFRFIWIRILWVSSYIRNFSIQRKFEEHYFNTSAGMPYAASNYYEEGIPHQLLINR